MWTGELGGAGVRIGVLGVWTCAVRDAGGADVGGSTSSCLRQGIQGVFPDNDVVVQLSTFPKGIFRTCAPQQSPIILAKVGTRPYDAPFCSWCPERGTGGAAGGGANAGSQTSSCVPVCRRGHQAPTAKSCCQGGLAHGRCFLPGLFLLSCSGILGTGMPSDLTPRAPKADVCRRSRSWGWGGGWTLRSLGKGVRVRHGG